MTIRNNAAGTFRPRMLAGLAIAALIAGSALSGCAGSSDAPRSLSFDSSSKKAIVVIGTSVNEAQDEEVRAGRSLSTFWQEYDPDTQQLVPGGRTFATSVGGGVFSAPDYLRPTVSVLEVDPGDYALIGAGFPHLMTLFVRSKPGIKRGDKGNYEAWTHTVDPRRHMDPAAAVDRQRNYLISVAPGQIVYVGHLQFIKPSYTDRLGRIDYSQDLAAAQAALADYPGIAGLMVIYDPSKPPQSVAR